MGQATIVTDGQKRYGACIGGMVSVVDGNVTLLPTTFEWAEDIDTQRVSLSEEKAQSVLENKYASDTDIVLAKARLKRALIRKGVAARR
jgi:F-type H+-transporting ATPase subunit epsilon